MIKKALLSIILIVTSSMLFAQENARWIRYPAISPDGTTIIFGYMGNLYRVAAKGGVAIPITTGDYYDMRPVWSHDGKTIAFASDRHGNFDVFTMSSSGGMPIRMTYNSANDYPYDFTVDDKKVLFGSGREAPAQSVRYPNVRFFQNLYTIPVNGGRPTLVTAAGAEEASYNSDGTQIVFQDRKGYEDPWRKHHTSSITRDIWLFNSKNGEYKQLSTFKGENREPKFGPDNQSVYYLNEKDGTQNLYKSSLEGGSETQLTHFVDFPVRHLSISKDNTILFTWKGDMYSVKNGSKPVKINVQVMDDAAYEAIKNVNINNVTEFAISPNGKEIAFVNRGEVFVSGIDDSRTKCITNTSEQERMIEWSPDGKSLLFSGERDGSWNIYKATIQRAEEKYFFASTLIKTEPVIATAADEFQPLFSPDGKKIAYVEERNVLKVLDLERKKTITLLPEGHNYSYSDGDWGFKWSPDNNWLLVDDEKGYMSGSNVALIKADGTGEIQYPVDGGFGESRAKWAMEGKMMTFLSSRDGRKSLANQGSKEVDIFAVFFDQEAYDRYQMSEEDYKLFMETEKDRKKNEKDDDKEDDEKKKGEKKGKDEGKKNETLDLNLKNIQNRKVKLTINSASIGDYVVNKDASEVYYLAAFEKGYDLWVTEPRTRATRILAKLGGSRSGIEMSEDGRTLFLSNRGRPVKVDAKSGKVSGISIAGEMELNTAAERNYIFNHIWRQVGKKFYDPAIHGIDWDMYRKEYEKFLPHINNNHDFQELLSEILGELNASHTGARYSFNSSNGDATASLGVLYDETYVGDGIKIDEVISGGPLDNAQNKIKKGDFIMEINGERVEASDNWNKYLINIAGKNVLLKVKSGKEVFEQTLNPVPMGAQAKWMYKRWVDIMTHMVDSLSKGQLGYVHVEGMNDGSYRDVYETVLGKNIDKKALIVDTRFNGGGWLHDDLNTFLSGKEYLKFAPQGNVLKGGEPGSRWTKPSIVLMSEGNYSDAFIFPYIYKQNGLGKLVGMPVPGTGTAVWWERQIDPSIVFGIPMIGTIGVDGEVTENKELAPDILVPLPYNDFLKGKDPQLETAVNELLKEVN